MNGETIRCDWANHSALEREYHDKKWGVPVHDERELFKMLILEGKQAGLSWSTILRKMDTLCAAFDDFDPAVIIHYDAHKVDALLGDSGVIRNRLKINAAIQNAKAYFRLCEAHGSLDRFFWSYVDDRPIVNAWTSMAHVPARTPLSDAIARDLKKLGFKFVGSTIIYAFMQSIGMVNDHLTSCAFYRRVR
ncbi:DNA-3-methyladenine glycosylase [Alphaproteobacteria bacterium]|nr:DNA-3-methyladenine glycosylase [Alphaproteobacteria bacterium]